MEPRAPDRLPSIARAACERNSNPEEPAWRQLHPCLKTSFQELDRKFHSFSVLRVKRFQTFENEWGIEILEDVQVIEVDTRY